MTRNHTWRLAGKCAIRLLSILLLVAANGLAFGQNAPSAEQMQIFRELSPEQQQALMQQIAGQQPGAEVPESAGGPSTRAPENAEAERRRRASGSGDPLPASGTLKPGDTVLVEIALPGTMAKDEAKTGRAPIAGALSASRRLRPQPTTPLSATAESKLSDLIQLVQAGNPYTIDRNGQLNLPGFAPVMLGGLNEQQAVQLLSAAPALLQLDVSLLLLPVSKTGVEALKPYGYDLFDNVPTSFSPVTDVPVPADYVVGPGDVLSVQMFGAESGVHRLVVSRDGIVSFPKLGPISVGGKSFVSAKANIESRVSQQLIGVRANVSVADTRTIRIFVLGDARQPGSYTVSGLATMTAALFASGGVTPIGSLRDIRLMRQGAVIRRFDLYDLLMRGDTSGDAKLQAGDVIFVPPVGPQVSIDGEVKRAAIYELRGDSDSDIAELLQMAGGLTTEADSSRASLERVDEGFRRVVLDVDFGKLQDRNRPLRNGDKVRVARLRPQLDSGVSISGAVHRAGLVAWRQGLRLSDVIPSIDELRANADAHYILVRRESGADRKVEVLSADLIAALAGKGSGADIQLLPRDQITIFDLAPGRERIIKPLLDELRLQSGLARPTEIVRIEGRVKAPGEYPLEPGMKVNDLLRAGGNLQAAAFGGKAELARYEVTSGDSRQTALIEINLAAVLNGDPAANIPLQPFDYLMIKETPYWTDQESVTLLGEVRLPGTYAIRRGETLYQVIARAGGFTDRAFPKGGVFTRLGLKADEQKQLDLLGERLQADLASLALQAAAANQADASQALASGQSLLTQLKQSRAVGRLIIDLPGLMNEGQGSLKDVVLRNGDFLLVPSVKQEVTVIGEVQVNTSHFYNTSFHRDDYLELSGGTTRRADKGRIYVVRADGSVPARRSGWLQRQHEVAIQPGDTIIVPLDTERLPRLPFWQAVTQIVYNLAVSVAAINSF
jgi:polysaccharide biosynthesis/export protein